MFELQTAWWEIVLRIAIIYFGLLVMVRVSGKRQLGQITPMDLLTMLVLAETVSPALTGEDPTVTAGLIAAATLIGITFGVGWVSYHSRWFERFTEGTPIVVIQD